MTELLRILLGLPAIEALNFLKCVHTVQVEEDIRNRYLTIFKGPEKLKEVFITEPEPGACPYSLSIPR